MVYPIIIVITYWLKPLVGSILACNLEGKVGKPTVGSSSVPVLHIGGNVDDCSRENLLRRLSLLLIPASTRHTDKHLSSALGCMMNVPIVAATRFEGNIGNGNLLIGNTCQITVALEIPCIGSIGLANGENHLLLETSLRIFQRRVFFPDLLSLAESSLCLGPSCIESYMGDDFRYFCSCDAVLLRLLQVVGER